MMPPSLRFDDHLSIILTLHISYTSADTRQYGLSFLDDLKSSLAIRELKNLPTDAIQRKLSAVGTSFGPIARHEVRQPQDLPQIGQAVAS